MPVTKDDPYNSFGSADSVKNYDYYRTRNRREISDAAGKSGGFVLRRLKAFESSNRELGTWRKSPILYRASYDPGHSLESILSKKIRA